ncbi:MAP kinase-interacting serine/threonine-protein kinase 1-like [Aplysia californica]|uniref:MAP kinase-interacting serine/threonine-protein kinase 1-like n=1 Tax=Aplysia californica TaxID=6500 RepID=A0ABM0ZUI0_APLCA|nr:MAP kinase-interacting serine/threonine-protein kinase 1-like [Aplysia californica]
MATSVDSSRSFDSSSSELTGKHNQVKQMTFANMCERYERTGKELGSGSYGSVVTFRNRKSGVEYAVKIIKNCDYSSRREVLKEINICQRYNNCANIIKLVEFCEIDDMFYLVFEKMGGGDLRGILESRDCLRLSETESSKVMNALTKALLILHKDGVAHRDIKSENILCKKSGEVTPLVLCDLGLATDLTSRRELSKVDKTKTTLTSPVGTILYMAPEVVDLMYDDSRPPYDTSCDMWSLGVLLYEMLFGVMPFQRGCDAHLDSTDFSCQDCETVLHEDILNGDFSFPENAGEFCSDSAVDLIQHLLVVDPQERYSAADVLQHPYLTANVSGDLAVHESIRDQVERKTNQICNTSVLHTSDSNTDIHDGVFCTSIPRTSCDSTGSFDSSSSELTGKHQYMKQSTLANRTLSY